MNYCYDVDKQTIVKVKPEAIETIEMKICIDDVLTLSYVEYMAAIRYQLAAQFSQLKENSNPTLLAIQFITNDILEFEDIQQFYDAVAAMLINLMVTDSPRYDEYRMSVNNEGIDLTYTNLMKLINYKSLFSCFNIRVEYEEYSVYMVG